MPAALEVDDVVKQWPGAPDPLLRAVSLRVPTGSTAAVLGQNGSGKTTLLRIVAGLLESDRGSIRWGACHPTPRTPAYQRQVGVVSAGNVALYARLSAPQHLDFLARIALVDARHRSDLIAMAAGRFGLAEFGRQRVDRLSMGQRQRVRLARHSSTAPPLVLLDEPLTSLDERGARDAAGGDRGPVARGGAVVWFGPSNDALPLAPDLGCRSTDGAVGAGMRLREALDGISAVVRRDAAIYFSYRLRAVSQLALALFSLTLFYYLSRLVGGGASRRPDDYFAYVVVGLVILHFLTATLALVPNALADGARRRHVRAARDLAARARRRA